MPSKVRAIIFHRHGVPAEVRVRLLAAPINPDDLNVIEGKYPIRPALPGVGRIFRGRCTGPVIIEDIATSEDI